MKSIYFEHQFCYVEIKSLEKTNTLILSPDFQSGTYRYIDQIKAFIDKLDTVYGEKKIILEAGVNAIEFKLFQANEVNDKILSLMFNNDLIFKILKSRQNEVASPGIFSLLNLELSAYRFRKSCGTKPHFSIHDAFKNWSYLFHYFYLFCRLKKIHATDQAFVDFLNHAQGKVSWMGKIILRHVQLSNKIRMSENAQNEECLETSFRLTGQEEYFLGSGIHHGKVADIGFVCDTLIPDDIYQLADGTIILTSSYNILSHGFLIAFERRLPVIANIPPAKFCNLKKEDFLTADFTRKSYVIE